MNSRGELSSEVAPCVLYHYSFLMEKEGLWKFTRLKFKEPINPQFLQYCNSHECSVAILVPEELKKEAEKVLDVYPFRRIYTYKNMLEVKQLSFKGWENIIVYFDEDGARGSFFRDRWRRE
ncbi:MAG: hypothetical protein AABY07_00925 [Nanoarchaeota archaeon]